MTKRKPSLPNANRPAIEEARKRHLARPLNPGVVVDYGKAGYRLSAPHRDQEAWEVQILDAFGTRSVSAARVFLDQLAAICRPATNAAGQWAPNQVDLNAMVAMVNSVRPRNEIEAALAAQMAAMHILTARVLAEAASVEGWVSPDKAALASKLVRTFAQQCDTLNRLKGRVGRQSIKVKYERHEHQHVHVEGGASEILGQGRALAGAKTTLQPRNGDATVVVATLPCEDAIGLAMSGAGGER